MRISVTHTIDHSQKQKFRAIKTVMSIHPTLYLRYISIILTRKKNS